jgi:2-iminobutanoate/2-iminopropanoate deaminase
MTNIVRTFDHGVSWEKEFGVTQAYAVNGTIHISGQFSHDMQGEFIGPGDIQAQTRQTLSNLDRVLTGYGVSRSNIAYMEIYLTNPQRDFGECITLFKEYLGTHRVAGTCLGVPSLVFPDQLIEISAVAYT